MRLLPEFAARFRAMSVTRKLTVSFIAITGIALLLAGLGIVTADSFLFYGYLRRDLITFVRIIGDNCSGSLAFNDAKTANETLAALRARTNVEAACLFEKDGTLLAAYMRPDYGGPCPKASGEAVIRTDWALVASHPIDLDGKPLGAIVLRYGLEEITDRIQIYGAMVFAAILLSSAITMIVSSRLRSRIAAPILELAGAANAVSGSKDYGIRAKKLTEDEIGELAEAFNQMLESIQSRDDDLKRALGDQRDALRRLAQLNADLKTSNAELARSNQDLERFAFVASHDLQEPLRMITSYSQLLVAEYAHDGNTETAEVVEHIVGGTRRMRELLADLLAYTEIAGSPEQPAEPVDLNVVVRSVTQTLGPRIAEAGAEIRSDSLPVVNTHEGRMTSLFLNLIGNAIKYRSEQPPRIHVSVEDSGDEFVFAVADNGIGIAEEYREKVFTAFKRLHGRNIPGTGIGLAICQRVVERCGGRIWVDSEPGKGSTFRFTLPKCMAE